MSSRLVPGLPELLSEILFEKKKRKKIGVCVLRFSIVCDLVFWSSIHFRCGYMNEISTNPCIIFIRTLK